MSIRHGPPRGIILGLMTVGPEHSKDARVTSLDEFKRCLDLFQQRGYTELDTARGYAGGLQEGFTQKAGWKDRGLSIATKSYPTIAHPHWGEALRAQLEESLAELQTDSIDIFYLHAADRSVPFAETFEELNNLYREKKFKRLGLSNFSAFEVAEVTMMCNEKGWVRPSIYQGVYNAITRGLESELIPCCRRYGIDVVIFNPLAGGLFTGKYKNGVMPNDGRFGVENTHQGKWYRDRYFKPSLFEALDIVSPVAEKHGLTMVEVALRWCTHHSALNIGSNGRDGIIIGFSSYTQLERNLDDFEKGPLPREVVDALDEAWRVSKGEAVAYWHGTLEYQYDTKKSLFNSSG